MKFVQNRFKDMSEDV